MQTINKFISGWLVTFRQQGIIGKFVFGCISLLILCFLCSIPIAILNPKTAAPVATRTISPTKLVEQTITPSPTKTPRPSATPNIGVVGERKEVGGIALTVLNITRMNGIDFLTPKEGNNFLVIEVLIENVSRVDEVPYNPLYFSVKDFDGYEYPAILIAPDPELQSGKLPKGDKARGFVAFEVKASAGGLVVRYEPIVILGGYEPIRIRLDQVTTTETVPELTTKLECPSSQGEVDFCIIEQRLVADPILLEKIVQAYCDNKGGAFCKVLMWTDLNYLPSSLPMSDEAVNYEVADYNRNKN